MNDRMDRAEIAIEKIADATRILTEKMQELADSQKHSDAKLDALTDIVRNWYERHGNGNTGPRPS